MTAKGVIFKRCGCRNTTGRRLERSCPRLPERGHGSWYFQYSAPNTLGRAERKRQGGFASRAAVTRARDEWLTATGEERTARAWTVGQWLRYWLSTRTRLKPTALLHYTTDVENLLIPHLGDIRLSDLDAKRLRAGFASLAASTNSKGAPQSASALHHARATLRAALNFAIREDILTDNPVRLLEIPAYKKPFARVWTDGRVKLWRDTGERPAVAVWTAVQLATFLTAVADDTLYAMWWLIGLRGLRRGEACGLRWSEVDLDAAVLFVVRNRTTAGYEVFEGDPKTAAGVRMIALARHTVAVLRAHRSAQQAAHARRSAAGKTWIDSGYVFVRKNGSALHPSYASTRFRLLIDRTGMPPVRLHDLRHGAASLSHQAGADLKDIQDLLGHSSILVTADTYTSVLPPNSAASAEATAQLVLAAGGRIRKKVKAAARRNRPPTAMPTGGPTPRRPGESTRPKINALLDEPESLSQSGRTPNGSPRAPHRPHKTNKGNRRR